MVGLAVVAGLFLTNTAGLATLVAQADLGHLAVLLMVLQFAGGFATFAVASALALPSKPQPRGRTAERPRQAILVARRRSR